MKPRVDCGTALEWTRAACAKIEPHTHGFYMNVYDKEDAARIRTTCGVNHERMVALKSKIDPNNLFHMNANVAPKKAWPPRGPDQPRQSDVARGMPRPANSRPV